MENGSKWGRVDSIGTWESKVGDDGRHPALPLRKGIQTNADRLGSLGDLFICRSASSTAMLLVIEA